MLVRPIQARFPDNAGDLLFNIKKGINQPITEGISASLTGIGYLKVKGGGAELRATITTDDGEQLIVNPRDLPPDVRNDKFYKITLDAVDEYYNSQVKNKPTTQPESAVSDQDKAALQWLKSNPNAPQAKAIKESLKAKGLIK